MRFCCTHTLTCQACIHIVLVQSGTQSEGQVRPCKPVLYKIHTRKVFSSLIRDTSVKSCNVNKINIHCHTSTLTLHTTFPLGLTIHNIENT